MKASHVWQFVILIGMLCSNSGCGTPYRRIAYSPNTIPPVTAIYVKDRGPASIGRRYDTERISDRDPAWFDQYYPQLDEPAGVGKNPNTTLWTEITDKDIAQKKKILPTLVLLADQCEPYELTPDPIVLDEDFLKNPTTIRPFGDVGFHYWCLGNVMPIHLAPKKLDTQLDRAK